MNLQMCILDTHLETRRHIRIRTPSLKLFQIEDIDVGHRRLIRQLPMFARELIGSEPCFTDESILAPNAGLMKLFV